MIGMDAERHLLLRLGANNPLPVEGCDARTLNRLIERGLARVGLAAVLTDVGHAERRKMMLLAERPLRVDTRPRPGYRAGSPEQWSRRVNRPAVNG